jgi:hypothetical protein
VTQILLLLLLLLLQIPEAVEEACSVPHYFICPITHSIMLALIQLLLLLLLLLLLQIPEAVEEAYSVPHYFICPITHSIMLEPAVTSSGATYERSAIMEWLRAQK